MPEENGEEDERLELFRQMVREAHEGDGEAIQVVADLARRHGGEREWRAAIAEAEDVLGPLDKLGDHPPVRRFEHEELDETGDLLSGARVAGGMFVVAAVIAVLAYFLWP